MGKKRTQEQLQKLYDELGGILLLSAEKYKIKRAREFCLKHDLPFRRVRKHFNPDSIKITKKLQRNVPQLPFSK